MSGSMTSRLWTRQSKRYALWRVSHPYRAGVAVRLICWFAPESDTVVVALFAGDKARIGDAFYNSVGSRADGLIDQWKREAMRGRHDQSQGRSADIRSWQ
ncbi:hypothetical protein [Kribbella sp. NBC_00359]|uniref:hypothetical protein n=1 Tax=Kribbella sp. NBC_00359 TaxID=2975966 RepID=UPI002E204625